MRARVARRTPEQTAARAAAVAASLTPSRPCGYDVGTFVRLAAPVGGHRDAPAPVGEVIDASFDEGDGVWLYDVQVIGHGVERYQLAEAFPGVAR